MIDTLYKLITFATTYAGTADCGAGQTCKTGLPVVSADNGVLTTALSIVFAIIGAIAVLMIVVGGLRLITSQGNPQESSKARGTLIYSAVGLLIALAAEGIVNFALKGL